jgi:hypothetical protein
MDVRRLALKNAVKSNIRYSESFLQWEAGTAAGLDMWLWESGFYPVRFKERVIAWYNLHTLAEAHSQDAAVTAAEVKAKRGRKR